MIRKISLLDSEDFLELCHQLDRESQFMMFEPGERNTTIEEQSEYIKSIIEEDKSVILICEIDGKIVGYVSAMKENFNRLRHNAYIVAGILKGFSGQGIGTKLFIELENWAKQNNLHRLELTVMCHNDSAIALYKKMGFQIEGIKKHSLIVDGHYIDEYYMAKLI